MIGVTICKVARIKMPRDLFSSHQSHELTLTESPEAKTPRPNASQDPDQLPSNAFTIVRDESDDREQQLSKTLRRSDEKNKLHPYVQLLSISDLEACVALETATFPERERCSREKVCFPLVTGRLSTARALLRATIFCAIQFHYSKIYICCHAQSH